MAVRLRLSRVGRKGVPFYRVVAIDSRKARDGEALDILGTYNGITGEILNFNSSGVDEWVKKGAQMADSVSKIYKKARQLSEKRKDSLTINS